MIDRYLAKHKRKPHNRINLRSALDIKTGTCLKLAMESGRSELTDGGNLTMKKQTSRLLATMHQKKLFSGATHKEKINKLVARQKLK